MAKQLILTNGMVALVDDEDFELASRFRWSPHTHKNKHGQIIYAETSKMTNRVRTRMYLHRLLMSAQPGELVDHRDGDGLNNQRANLRLCTRVENGRNAAKTGGRLGTSKFKGVDFHVGTGRWRARIDGLHIGLFDSEEDAANAYDVNAVELHGEFARPNFIT
jgi:hypothetical protein